VIGELGTLGLTLVIEVPIYGALLHGLLGVRLSAALAAGVVVNLASHPLSFVAVQPATKHALGEAGSLALVELVIAWWGEAGLLWLWLRRERLHLLAISFVANGTSFAIGLLVVR
jgi:hypothetical protein